jgi:NAD dependent epimerase/dehydratase family enzyme
LGVLLEVSGYRVLRLARGTTAQQANAVAWLPDRPLQPDARLEGLAAVVHLAGEPIVGRWTPAKRALIRSSRVEATRHLIQGLAGLRQPPPVLVCASAVGYYGDRGESPLTEGSGGARG